MKNISFFNVIKSIVYSLTLVLFMSIVSFSLVSFFQFNHQQSEISYQNIAIYKEEDVNCFKGYFSDNNLYLIIEMKKAQSNEYLVDYAYHYFFDYNVCIYLEVDNVEDIKYVNITLDGISTIV